MASMGVTFTGIASVTDCNLLSPTTNTHIDTPISGVETTVYPSTLTALPSSNSLSSVCTASGTGMCLAESKGHSTWSDLGSGARVVMST